MRVLHNVWSPGYALDFASGNLNGGWYDSIGTLIETSRRIVEQDVHFSWNHSAVSRPLVSAGGDVARSIDNTTYIQSAIFAGFVFNSWGHNLLEIDYDMLTELDSNLPLLFVPWGAIWSKLSNFEKLLRNAGISNPILYVSSPASASTLLVPRRQADVFQVSQGSAAINSKSLDLFQEIARKFEGEKQNCVFLGRGLRHRRRSPVEEALEDFARSAGCRVIDCSTEDFEVTVQACRSSRLVIGFQGSALHNAVFSPPGTKVVQLADLVPRFNLVQGKIASSLGHEFLDLGLDYISAENEIAKSCAE
jgi:capsular polysaccharide biosynthesis protein